MGNKMELDLSELERQFWDKLKAGYFYSLRHCSMCNYPLGYKYDNRVGGIVFDAGCYCVRDIVFRPVQENDLKYLFNPNGGHIESIQNWVKTYGSMM
jgi:hypothetical protein